MKQVVKLFLVSLLAVHCRRADQRGAIVIQTDFGLKDGAVAAMKGVACGVDPELSLYDLTHEIPVYNIWEASYRLEQVLQYWPAGTVFVSVVDPGVGTQRKSIVARTKTGHFIVTPDNGTLTLVAANQGIESVREIDETLNRRAGSGRSYTFHGRDVYAYTAARLASGKISFEEVGPVLGQQIVLIDYAKPALADGQITGNIPVLDVQYGNVWSNIPDSLVRNAGIHDGDSVMVTIFHEDSVYCDLRMPLVNSFGDVADGRALAYFNSLMNFSVAMNMQSFADRFRIRSGPDWKIRVTRVAEASR